MMNIKKWCNTKGFISSDKTPAEDIRMYNALKKKSEDLQELGYSFIQQNPSEEHGGEPPYREEFCVSSDLHRGFYCPSPVFDYLVGNTHRGKILKRVQKRSQITHRYLFDQNGRLVQIEAYYNNKTFVNEYLLYKGNAIYGVSISSNGSLYGVSEEIYEHGVLQSYTNGYCAGVACEDTFSQIFKETYFYDDMGIAKCGRLVANFQIGHISNDHYVFEREDGYLTGYRCADSQWQIYPDATLFKPGIIRKA